MNHVTWLRSRMPEAPRTLVRHIQTVLEAHVEWESLSRADAFVEASQCLLRRVLAIDPVARASALDLLAADACVTFAFESAADDPAAISARAKIAKGGIAGVAAEYLSAASFSLPGSSA